MQCFFPFFSPPYTPSPIPYSFLPPLPNSFSSLSDASFLSSFTHPPLSPIRCFIFFHPPHSLSVSDASFHSSFTHPSLAPMQCLFPLLPPPYPLSDTLFLSSSPSAPFLSSLAHPPRYPLQCLISFLPSFSPLSPLQCLLPFLPSLSQVHHSSNSFPIPPPRPHSFLYYDPFLSSILSLSFPLICPLPFHYSAPFLSCLPSPSPFC
jgi:hypothetical protein